MNSVEVVSGISIFALPMCIVTIELDLISDSTGTLACSAGTGNDTNSGIESVSGISMASTQMV